MRELLEQIQEKWKPVFRPDTGGEPAGIRPGKQERLRDLKIAKALSSGVPQAEHLLNAGISGHSTGLPYRMTQAETISRLHRYKRQENMLMMIFVLAAAMTVAMLIATVFALHQEAQQLRLTRQRDRFSGFGR